MELYKKVIASSWVNFVKNNKFSLVHGGGLG